MAKQNNIGSFTLTNGGPYVISDEDGIYTAAFKLLSGSATLTGAAIIKCFGGASTAVALTIDEGVTISSEEPIDNLTLTISSGVVSIFTSQ